MFSVNKVMDTEFGSITISVILGLGLAALFRTVCKDGKCIVIQGPKNEDVQGQYFKINDDCFKYTPVQTACDKK